MGDSKITENRQDGAAGGGKARRAAVTILWTALFTVLLLSPLLLVACAEAALVTGSIVLGNGNGLCESGEVCLRTPNIGSYQGHGPISQVGAFTGGTLSGIILVQHQSNGH